MDWGKGADEIDYPRRRHPFCKFYEPWSELITDGGHRDVVGAPVARYRAAHWCFGQRLVRVCAARRSGWRHHYRCGRGGAARYAYSKFVSTSTLTTGRTLAYTRVNFYNKQEKLVAFGSHTKFMGKNQPSVAFSEDGETELPVEDKSKM